MAEFVPLGEDDQRVGRGQRLVVGLMIGDPVAEDAPRAFERLGIVRAHARARRQQFLDHRERRRLAHVVGARLEGQPPYREGAAVKVGAEVLLDALDDEPFLAHVDVVGRAQQREVEVMLGGAMDQRLHVLGKARAAVADAGKEKLRSDSPVRAHPAPHVAYFRAHRFAQVRHLVDERNAHRQHRVARRTWSARPSAGPSPDHRIVGAQEGRVQFAQDRGRLLAGRCRSPPGRAA